MKQLITFLVIIFTSFQVNDITTNKLDHSRNFIRFLNYFVIGHTDFGFYWVGQYALNYPIHEYYQLGEVYEFLSKLEKFMQ